MAFPKGTRLRGMAAALSLGLKMEDRSQEPHTHGVYLCSDQGLSKVSDVEQKRQKVAKSLNNLKKLENKKTNQKSKSAVFDSLQTHSEQQ